jgi:hypothetical protein
LIFLEKIKVFIKNGDTIEEQYKGKYDPDDELVEIKKRTGLLTREPERYQIDSNHIIKVLKKRGRSLTVEKWVIVDRKTRKSVLIGNSKASNVNQQVRNQLDFLVDKGFWKALMERVRISTFTALILMFAGYGILRFIEYFFSIAMR